jgi:hypothetical protein
MRWTQQHGALDLLAQQLRGLGLIQIFSSPNSGVRAICKGEMHPFKELNSLLVHLANK